MGADLTWEELKDDSLGLDLVESLTEQLDGKMKLDTSAGFHYTFIFPLLS
jgi:two-component sensor histidine kinase